MVSRCWWVVFVAVGCSRPPPSGDLVSEAKSGLATRQGLIHSYRFDAAMSDPSGQRNVWSVAYRAPASYRVDTPTVSYVLDGEKFFEIDHATGRVLPSALSREHKDRSLERVYSVFAPYIPEGWRSPLIGSNVTAAEGPVAGEQHTVLLSVGAHAANEQAELEYQFSRPAMDWLKTETVATGHRVVRAATRQHCDKTSVICFPEQVEVRKDGVLQSTTTLSRISVNESLPAETFAPGGR